MENLTAHPEFIALIRRIEALERKRGKMPAPVGERIPSHIRAKDFKALLQQGFVWPDDSHPTIWLTTTEIAARLNINDRHLKTLGQTLKDLGFERKSVRIGANVQARYAIALR